MSVSDGHMEAEVRSQESGVQEFRSCRMGRRLSDLLAGQILPFHAKWKI